MLSMVCPANLLSAKGRNEAEPVNLRTFRCSRALVMVCLYNTAHFKVDMHVYILTCIRRFYLNAWAQIAFSLHTINLNEYILRSVQVRGVLKSIYSSMNVKLQYSKHKINMKRYNHS